MPEFTATWFDANITSWTEKLAHLAGQPDVHALELGCWEGRASCWLLEHILTGPGATLTVIDTFQGSAEHVGVDMAAVERRFRANTAPYAERLAVIKDSTMQGLARLLQDYTGWDFDFIYVDANHAQVDTLTDGVMAWPLLKVGGLMCFDDYLWRHPMPDGEVIGPKEGVDAFLLGFGRELTVLEHAVQVWTRKNR